ncbi:hypothetical protein BGZ73_006975 [Actinomortierella ambigua]|nr:hypothetical protein BGZ73_006975 [Actinomortierella ambigua]
MATTHTQSSPRPQHHRRLHPLPQPSTPNPSAAIVFMAAAAVAVASSPSNHHPSQQSLHHIHGSLGQPSAPIFTPASISHETQGVVVSTAFEAITATHPQNLEGVSVQPEQGMVPLEPSGSLVTEYAMVVHFEHPATSLPLQAVDPSESRKPRNRHQEQQQQQQQQQHRRHHRRPRRVEPVQLKQIKVQYGPPSVCKAEGEKEDCPCDHVSRQYTCRGDSHQHQPAPPRLLQDRGTAGRLTQEHQPSPPHDDSNGRRHHHQRKAQRKHPLAQLVYGNQDSRPQFHPSPKTTPGPQLEHLPQPAHQTATAEESGATVRGAKAQHLASSHNQQAQTESGEGWERTVRNEAQEQEEDEGSFSTNFEIPFTPAVQKNNNRHNPLDRSESLHTSSIHETTQDDDQQPLDLYYQASATKDPSTDDHTLPDTDLYNDRTWTVDEIYEQLQHFSSSATHVVVDPASSVYGDDHEDDAAAIMGNIWIGDDDYIHYNERVDDESESWSIGSRDDGGGSVGVDEDLGAPKHLPPPTTLWQGQVSGPVSIQGSQNDISNDVITGSLVQLPLTNPSPTLQLTPWIALAPCTATSKDIQPAIDQDALAILLYHSPDEQHPHGQPCAGLEMLVQGPKSGGNNPVKLSGILPVLTLDDASALNLLVTLEDMIADLPISVTISLISNRTGKDSPARLGDLVQQASTTEEPEKTPHGPKVLRRSPSLPPSTSSAKQPSIQVLTEEQLNERHHHHRHEDMTTLQSMVTMISAAAKRVRRVWIELGLEGCRILGVHCVVTSGDDNIIDYSMAMNAKFQAPTDSTEEHLPSEDMDSHGNFDCGDEDVSSSSADILHDQETDDHNRASTAIYSNNDKPSRCDQPLARRRDPYVRTQAVSGDTEAGVGEEAWKDQHGNNQDSQDARQRQARPRDTKNNHHPEGATVHHRVRSKPNRLVQRVAPAEAHIHLLITRQVWQESIMLNDNSMTARLLMVFMSTVCGVGVGMFGALLFVVALKVRLFQSRRPSQGGTNSNNSNTNSHQQQQQRQQQLGGLGLNLLQPHGMGHSGGVAQKKVVPRGVLESFGVQTVLETSATCTKTTAMVPADLSILKKGRPAYAEDVLEMEQGFEEIADRDQARRERRRSRSRALLVGTSSTAAGGSSSSSSDDHVGDDHGQEDGGAEDDHHDHMNHFRPSQQPQRQDSRPLAAATTTSEGTEANAEQAMSSDEYEEDQVVPTGEEPTGMEQITVTILNATRRGTYRRTSHQSRQGRSTNHRGPGAEPETMSASSSISLSVSFVETTSTPSSTTTATTRTSASSSSSSSSPTPSSVAEPAASRESHSKTCNDANGCHSTSNKEKLPFANANAQTMCAICLAEYEVGERVRTLPCYHQFHQTCIDPWLLQIASLCPICKRDLWPGPQG